MRLLSATLLSLLTMSTAYAASCRAPRLRQGMVYDKARQVVISAGFQAPKAPAYGYTEKDDKVVSECSGDVKMCNDYPEIEACSGQGQCNMTFDDAYGNKLTVTTYGDGPRGAKVTTFQIECKK